MPPIPQVPLTGITIELFGKTLADVVKKLTGGAEVVVVTDDAGTPVTAVSAATPVALGDLDRPLADALPGLPELPTVGEDELTETNLLALAGRLAATGAAAALVRSAVGAAAVVAFDQVLKALPKPDLESLLARLPGPVRPGPGPLYRCRQCGRVRRGPSNGPAPDCPENHGPMELN